jgi:hypothetical protein
MLIALGLLAMIVGLGCTAHGARLLEKRSSVFHATVPQNFLRAKGYQSVPKVGIGTPAALMACGLVLTFAGGLALVLLSFG